MATDKEFKVWTTRSGQRIKVEDINNDHLINIISHLNWRIKTEIKADSSSGAINKQEAKEAMKVCKKWLIVIKGEAKGRDLRLKKGDSNG
jgi:hypothetical protein